LTLCEVCERNEAKYACKLCGRKVCSKHIDSDGICSICKLTLCERCHKYHAIGYCKICGRVLCEDCLVQVSPVEYVCIDCYTKYFGEEKKLGRILPKGFKKFSK